MSDEHWQELGEQYGENMARVAFTRLSTHERAPDIVQEIAEYQTFVKTDPMPRADGSVRLWLAGATELELGYVNPVSLTRPTIAPPELN